MANVRGRHSVWLQWTLACAGLAAGSVWLHACTPGAPGAPSAAQGPIPGALVIEESLGNFQTQTPDGLVSSYNPGRVTVPRGSIIQFHNQDNFAHTATFLSTTSFPTGSPLTQAAEMSSGGDLAQPGWSSGRLEGNQYSQGLVASTPGKYFYGCFYHYGSPMRGAIIVQ